MATIPTASSQFTPIQDSDPAETQEWLSSFDEVLKGDGALRCQHLLHRLHQRAMGCGVNISLWNTPYCNTIPPNKQAVYPGDISVERRITAIVRWNALAMVVRANRHSTELGGHLSSYASAADLFEVGFNHFFRADSRRATGPSQADLVFFQPHSSPGVYARAFLEGRLTEAQLDCYRRESGGRGLPSYPHPWLLPDFWQFPTGSMGLGIITAIYQARFMHYLQNRGLANFSQRKVWAFVGDGEMDEPESLGGLAVAGRENLDNLIVVVNCNLQRLDGPVRGNGSIVQELERLFAAAGWNVIKVLWGSDWDDLFARDRGNWILKRLHETLDGELQSYGARDARYNRERFFSKYEELRQLVSHLSDAQIDALTRGGHDPIKIYAAFHAAVHHSGQPSVVLALTKKGYGLGDWAEGKMSSHQQKKITSEALLRFRDKLELSISNEDAEQVRFYRPPSSSPEIRYLLEQRMRLGGFLPQRRRKGPELQSPGRASFASFAARPEPRQASTTVAFVRMMTSLLKEDSISKYMVPIIADEARTFGMESLFRKIGIYSHCGQLYEPEDRDYLLHYRESRDGQILEEGITEAGALSSWIAAGTAYSTHGIPLIPFYMFYSMFGFQRVGDLIWAAADSRARGFLLGATSGRTSLSGEGLQHQDGTSHLIASTIPNCRAYDPCFAYELAVILDHGMRAMLQRQEDVFYYITLMNENYLHPPMPSDVETGILRGMYRVRPSGLPALSPRVQLLGSGSILREVLTAADLLEQDWGIGADVWSVTSFSELRRSGLEVERYNRLNALCPRHQSWVEECLSETAGPIVAATDYVRAVPDLIRTWVPRRYVTLGTDGFGLSDTRAELRRHFEVDSINIGLSALVALANDGVLSGNVVSSILAKYEPKSKSMPPWADHAVLKTTEAGEGQKEDHLQSANSATRENASDPFGDNPPMAT